MYWNDVMSTDGVTLMFRLRYNTVMSNASYTVIVIVNG